MVVGLRGTSTLDVVVVVWPGEEGVGFWWTAIGLSVLMLGLLLWRVELEWPLAKFGHQSPSLTRERA